MKTIILIVPYFGKLPSGFQLWLEGCRFNPTINWLLFTDDQHAYDYPQNVCVRYTSFPEIKKRIQKLYDFPIVLDSPYKLCDYRVAYGEIFENEIKGYDFWGYCDVDLLFGNIRKLITNEILETYEKIGFQGHLTFFKNCPEAAKRYRESTKGIPSYQEIFTSSASCLFDENIIEALYDYLQIPVYREVHFAHLLKYFKDFHLGYLPQEEAYKNDNNIFSWKKGTLYRYYLKNGSAARDEMLYIHFFCREMNIKIRSYDNLSQVILYPNCIEEMNDPISETLIKRKAHTSLVIFKLKYLYKNRKKISPKKILDYLYQSRKETRGY